MSKRNKDAHIVETRHALILKALQRSGEISVDEICKETGVSVATMRRDLRSLENRSLLRRTHGGAILVEPLFYEPFKHNASFQDTVGSQLYEKRRIAEAAARLVKPGNVISLTAGTTTIEVVRSLRLLTDITVITNTVNVAMELSNRPDIEVVVTGGLLRGGWFSLVGPLANHAAESAFADIMFIGINGLDPEKGLTCLHPHEAEVNRLLLKNARRKIVVADHTKFGCVSRWLLCSLQQVDMILTDSGASDAMIAPFLEKGVAVERV